MTKTVKRKAVSSRSPDQVRSTITHPTLIDAFDVDWYYPWTLPEEAKKEKCVQRAIKEGWAEWIESEEDLQAVRAGYVYDLSRDKEGKPIYWLNGAWHRYQGTGKNRRLVRIRYDDDADLVGYCGAGDHMCRFAELALTFTKDPMKGKPYRFLKWQRKLCMTLFGWVQITRTKDGKTIKYRRFREAMVELPKKSGKSDLGSVISIYLVRADFSTKAYVYGCAAGKKQAGIIFDEAKDYVEKSELADEILVVASRQRFTHLESGSYYQVLSGEAGSNDGPDAAAVLFDELHRQKNRRLLSVMKRSGRARRSKFLLLIITTYGETLKGIWGEEHKKAKAQLAGAKFNHRRYVMIASAEPINVIATTAAAIGDTVVDVWRLEQPIADGSELKFDSPGGGVVTARLTAPARRFQRFIEVEPLAAPLPAFSEAVANKEWRDDHAIIRANPSVGIVYPIEEIREDREDSIGSPEAEAEFKQLSLNIVSGGGHRWLSGAVWQHNARHRVLMSSLIGQRCFGGGDFSLSIDLTAFWLAFPSWSQGTKFSKVAEPLIRLVGLVWVPEEGIEEREEKEEIPYRAYAEMPYIGEMGCVRICPGPVIDYQMVGNDIVNLCARFKLQAIAYDPAYSQLVVDPYLSARGLKCIPHRQGGISMGPPTVRFEHLLKRGLIAHGSHPVLDEAINGAVLRKDGPNKFPSKEKSTSRIDPLIAAIMAVGWACDPPVELKNSGAWSGKGTGAFGS